MKRYHMQKEAGDIYDWNCDIVMYCSMGERLKRMVEEERGMIYDFNLDNDLDIKPIAKSEAHFIKWAENYPFYANIHKEGVILYGAA